MVDVATVLLGAALGAAGGLSVGILTAYVTSFYIEPKSIRRDRMLRHVDSLLSDTYGPAQYALKRAYARGTALERQPPATSLDYAFNVGEAKILFETFHEKWGFTSKEVQEAWLKLVSNDSYMNLESLAEGRLNGLVSISQEDLASLAAAIDQETSHLRSEYELASGVALSKGQPGHMPAASKSQTKYVISKLRLSIVILGFVLLVVGVPASAGSVVSLLAVAGVAFGLIFGAVASIEVNYVAWMIQEIRGEIGELKRPPQSNTQRPEAPRS